MNTNTQKKQTKEIWKDIPGYEGDYQVSDLGNLRSVKEGVIREKSIPVDKNGYSTVRLFRDGVGKTFAFHKLMAITFLGHKPCGYEEVVDHINSIKTDNRLVNLRLVTTRENNSKPNERNKTSKYVGVSYHKPSKKWKAQISIDGIVNYLGLFFNEKAAAEAYKRALEQI